MESFPMLLSKLRCLVLSFSLLLTATESDAMDEGPLRRPGAPIPFSIPEAERGFEPRVAALMRRAQEDADRTGGAQPLRDAIVAYVHMEEEWGGDLGLATEILLRARREYAELQGMSAPSVEDVQDEVMNLSPQAVWDLVIQLGGGILLRREGIAQGKDEESAT